METKDRWWLGSASLSGEEYPYLLRKLEYWGTTFNNASLTTKASQLRLPLPLILLPQPFRHVIDQIFHPLASTKSSMRKEKLKDDGIVKLDPPRSSSFPSDSKGDVFQFDRVERVSIVDFFFSFFFSSFIRPRKEKTFLSSRRYVIRFEISARFTRIHSHSIHVGIYIVGHG